MAVSSPIVARGVSVVLSLLLAACAQPVASPDTTDRTSTEPSPAATPVPETIRALLARYEGEGDPAQSPIHLMWASALPEADAATLEPPSVVVGYEPGEIPPIACADQLAAHEWAGNAFYCPIDGSIAYDAAFVGGFVEAVGDSAASAILAHEWGHHLQRHMGVPEFDIQAELQADCYAGAFASRDDLGATDQAASFRSAEAFYELGDELYSNSSWFSPQEHGSPWQRMAAWSLGYLAVVLGYEICRGYDGWEPGQVVEIGPYRFVEFPGRAGSATGPGYVLDDGALGPLGIDRVEIGSLDGETPRELLDSWLDQAFGPRLGSVIHADGAANADEVAIAYWTADADERAGIYGSHGIIGLQVSSDDPGHALIFDRPIPGTVPIDTDPDQATFDAVLQALQVVMLASHRVCAPHHTQGGDPDTHNAMCFPDL